MEGHDERQARLDALEDEILHLIEREWSPEHMTSADVADLLSNLADQIEDLLGGDDE